MKLSVLMPSYNYGRFIGQAIRSCETTTFETEVVVQDAGSSDETAAVLSSISGNVAVKYFIEPDGGQSDALNRALERSTGEVIGWLNADELYIPRSLDRIMDTFRKNPEVDVVHADTIFINETGRFERAIA